MRFLTLMYSTDFKYERPGMLLDADKCGKKRRVGENCELTEFGFQRFVFFSAHQIQQAQAGAIRSEESRKVRTSGSQLWVRSSPDCIVEREGMRSNMRLDKLTEVHSFSPWTSGRNFRLVSCCQYRGTEPLHKKRPGVTTSKEAQRVDQRLLT